MRTLDFAAPDPYTRGMSSPDGDPRDTLRPVPRRLDARMTAWLIEQRAGQRARELELARLQGELSASERIERAAQRYADRLEEKLADARRREASLARAVGYLESQRDQLLQRLGLPPVPRGEAGELVPLPESTTASPQRRR